MRENKKPLVSVLMGVCYRRKDLGLLKRSVESVLNQTFTNFELLICDGGSSDEAIHLLDSLANDDHRIQLVRDNRIPTDLAHKLNVCLHYARGDLIARMDDDDFSAPERFERQVQYLESHPDIAFVGCNVTLQIDGKWVGNRIFPEYPQVRDFCFTQPFIHPTLMFRREIMLDVNGYSEDKYCLLCEDYDLLLRLYEQGLKGANLQERLLDYMVLSNFDIEIGGVLLQEYIVPYRWLSSDISYDPDSYTGESFLMLTDAEAEVFEKQIGFAVLGDPSQILSYDGFKIYVYPYNIAENDFYGRGYSNTEMIDTMVTSSEQMRQLDGTISISAGEVVYGPYITLPRGEYQIDIDFSEIGSEIYMRLTSDAGETLLSENTIKDIDYTVTYEALDDLENFEIVLSTNDLAILDSIRLTKLD